MLERKVEHATRNQGVSEATTDLYHLRSGHVQQRRAGPDAVELGLPLDIVEGHLKHFEPSVRLRSLDHLLGRIECDYIVAHLGENFDISTGPAASIKHAASCWEKLCEAPLESAHVRVDRILKEPIGVLVVVADR
jgi:hypothetical protein